jgi:uncharacterized membrane protein YraQ (UPF0718 family)
MEIIKREFIYLWYYFSIQFEQIFWYWVLGMFLGSLVSVFGKEKIHTLFVKMRDTKMGVFGIIPASLLGIASPLCMYGTIPIAASFAEKGMAEEWIASFVMSSILLNPASFLQCRPGNARTCYTLCLLFFVRRRGRVLRQAVFQEGAVFHIYKI